jgi:hypothetical protein
VLRHTDTADTENGVELRNKSEAPPFAVTVVHKTKGVLLKEFGCYVLSGAVSAVKGNLGK